MFAIVMMNRFSSMLGSVLGGAGLAAMSAVKTLRRIVVNRAQVRTLADMDERALHDIGLTRSEVHGALSTSMFADPSLVLCARDADRRNLVSSHQRAGDRRDVVKKTPVAPECMAATC